MSATASTRAALRSEAAHWLVLRQSGDMTVDDDHRFHEWLGRSESHQDAYALIDRAWIVAGTAAGDPEILATRDPEPEPAEDARPSQRWRFFALAASLMLAFTIGWTSFQGGLFDDGAAPERPAQSFRTGTGQRTVITLPDRSVVTLDSETEVRVHDGVGERRIELLAGRAFFRVTKDPKRPFIVMAGGKNVRAIGTAFEVSFDHGNMVVTLAEGKVRVEEEVAGSGNSTDMVPGGQLIIGADHNWTLSRVDVEKEVSWTEGRLIFMGDPLSEAVAEMNRYSDRKLVFKDGAIPDKQVVGVFKSGDVDGFVKALELNGSAQRVTTSDDEILLSAPPS